MKPLPGRAATFSNFMDHYNPPALAHTNKALLKGVTFLNNWFWYFYLFFIWKSNYTPNNSIAIFCLTPPECKQHYLKHFGHEPVLWIIMITAWVLNFTFFLLQMMIIYNTHRVVNVSHLQQVFRAAILLHLYGLPAPLHGYPVIFREVRVRGHLHVSALKDDLIDVVFVSPERPNVMKVTLTPNLLFHFCDLGELIQMF